MKKTVILSLAIAGLMQVTGLQTTATAGTNSVNKDSAAYYLKMGQDEQTARRYSNAWKFYEKAAGFDAGSVDAQKGIASVCLQMNKFAPAIKALETTVNLRPDDYAAATQLTKLYFNYGSWDKVITYASEMHSVAPDAANWAYMLGKSYYSLQNYGKAIEYLKMGAKFEPANSEAYYLISHIYTMMSNYSEGIPYYRKSLQLDSSTSAQVRLYEYALVLSTAGQYDESIAVFEQALSHGYKARDDFYMNMAYTMADAHQTDKAIKMLEGILSRRPQDIGVIEALADVNYHSGRYNQAIACWDKLLAINDKNARALYQIGLAYIKLGKNADGQQLCDQAIAIDPSLASLRRERKMM